MHKWRPWEEGFSYTKAHFTLGVKANIQPISSLLMGAKIEISPKGFALRDKAEIKKTYSQSGPSY